MKLNKFNLKLNVIFLAIAVIGCASESSIEKTVETPAAGKVVEIPVAGKTNGCGPEGFIGILVPDKTFITKCNFKYACDNHDICYGKCLPGGKLFGMETCNNEFEKSDRKKECDKNLGIDIVNSNKHSKICGIYSEVYQFAVSNMGRQYFKGIEGDKDIVFNGIFDFIEYVNNNPKYFDIDNFLFQMKNFGKIDSSKYSIIFSNYQQYKKKLEIIGFEKSSGLIVKLVSIQGKDND